jgi:cell division transport system permease protein
MATGGDDLAAPGLSLDLQLLPWQWGVLGLLPFATALIAMVTARWTVLRSLARFI